MVNILRIIQKLLDSEQTKFNYEELLRLYSIESGNFSPSSFEKFLSFSYGLNVLIKNGRKNERFYYLDTEKAKAIIQEWVR